MKKYLFLALIALAACNKDKDDKDNGPALMPLTIGNKWTFDFKVYDDNGSVVSTEPNHTIEVFKKGTKEGYYSIAEDDSEQLFSSSTEIIGYSPDEDEVILWKLRKTEKKETFETATDVDGYKYEYISYPGTMQVLIYDNCFKNEVITYDETGTLHGKDIFYVSPGIGIVRLEYHEPDGNGGWILDSREDLISYTIK